MPAEVVDLFMWNFIENQVIGFHSSMPMQSINKRLFLEAQGHVLVLEECGTTYFQEKSNRPLVSIVALFSHRILQFEFVIPI
jgi:hypothetical protein